MVACTFTRCHSFTQALAEKKFNLSTDTIKIVLTNTAPNVATNAVYADLTPITAEHGYSAGGPTSAQTATSAGGVYNLALADVTITAAGGTVGPFQYGYPYSSTATNKDLIGVFALPAPVTLQDAQSFTWDFSALTGALAL